MTDELAPAAAAARAVPLAEVGRVPVAPLRRRWPAVLGGALTLLMVAGLGRELLGDGLAGLGRSVPQSPWFFLAFAGLYLSLPVGDWIIFRRLWGIPASGLAALVKKRIANEVVLSYSGEAYFYAWARANARVEAPFGAVKDVSVLSAVAGNVITLMMMAVSLPLGHGLLRDGVAGKFAVSALVLLAMTAPFVVWGRKVFSLPRRTLWWVFGVHVARLVAGSVLIALAWASAMPAVPVAMWLFLAAGRLLVSRLPLVPNKDLIFANFAIAVIGQGEALSDLVAFTAAMFLVAHVVLIAAFGVAELVRRARA